MSRAFCTIRARRALDLHPLISTPRLSMCLLPFFLGDALLISPVSTRRLHTHTEAVPSTFHHSADSGRRTATPSSGDVSESLVQHLSKTFPPLEFPPELAQRVLTHLSHRDSVTGHNSRFAFLGGVASYVQLL
jgi:hypothetical protein